MALRLNIKLRFLRFIDIIGSIDTDSFTLILIAIQN